MQTSKLRKLQHQKTDEHNFVLSSWLQSYRKSPLCYAINTDIYYDTYRPFVTILLTKSECLVACNTEDENQIFGYAVYRDMGGIRIISFVYIKHVYRNLGFARQLIEEISKDNALCAATHFQPWLENVLKKYKIEYNPFFDLSYLEVIE